MKVPKRKILHQPIVATPIDVEEEWSIDTQEQQETIDLEELLAEVGERQPKENESKQQETQENLQDEEQVESAIDWSLLRATKSKSTKKTIGEAGVCTVVNCLKNGNKRIVLASKLLKQLGEPTSVEIGIMPNGIAIASSLPIDANSFQIRKQGAKSVIYAGQLVNELVEEFNLDYSERTSITFSKVQYEDINGICTAMIEVA